jgi:predicted amidohydrolase
MKTLRVAAVSMRSEFGDPDANLATILDWMQQAAEGGVQLVCFPEIALQGYCTVLEVVHRTAEPIDGPRIRQIETAARELDITASVGMSLRLEGKVFNSQVFIGPTGFLGAQHKVHLCPADHTYEPGDQWEVMEAAGWRIGTTICFDSAYPEAARILALKGADLVLMTFASGRRDRHGAPAKPHEFAREIRKWAPSRAFDSRIFVVGLNHAGEVADPNGYAVANPDGRAGVEEWAPPGTVHRWPGYNFAIDPAGDIFAETNLETHEPCMLVADLDPQQLAAQRAPIDVKTHKGIIRGDYVAVRRRDTFGQLLEPDGRPN